MSSTFGGYGLLEGATLKGEKGRFVLLNGKDERVRDEGDEAGEVMDCLAMAIELHFCSMLQNSPIKAGAL